MTLESINKGTSFEHLQRTMKDEFHRRVIARGETLEAAGNQRMICYLYRWREALNFFMPGRLLDIGGGYSYPVVVEEILSRKQDYWYLDIDPAAKAETCTLFGQYGVPVNHFSTGTNDHLAYEDAYFDNIFSSHCIEHSSDLAATLSELNRVLKDNGMLCLAVPIGFDEAEEHMYVMSADDWMRALQISGFEIQSINIGKAFTDWAYDLFIAVRKVGPVFERFDASPYDKSKWKFVPHDDARFQYTGAVKNSGFCTVLLEPGSSVYWMGPDAAHMLLVRRHGWSGLARVKCDSQQWDCEQYSAFPMNDSILLPAGTGSFEVASCQANRHGQAAQVTVLGLLTHR